ncbi:unnamed protein product, partial [Coregonus sp. 'balchen']
WNIEESTEYEAIITGLHSETTYSVTVAAYTTKGDGARSKAKVITTTGAVPGRPTMMISTTMGDTALIQWQPPKDMAYTSREFKRTDDHHTVTNLHKGATYVFRLSALNRAGIGEAYVKEISTQEDVPSGYPLNIRVTGGKRKGLLLFVIMVSLAAFATSFGVKAVMKTSVLLTWYYIVVVPVSQSSSRLWENPDEMDLEELLESDEGPVLRRRRQVEPTRPYIAAKLASLPATFTLGDEKSYNGFFNRPLPSHQRYLAFVLAALKEQEQDNSDRH